MERNGSSRVALVTGAARGIGSGIALRLAADGLDVAVNDIGANSDQLDGVAEEIRAAGRPRSSRTSLSRSGASPTSSDDSTSWSPTPV